MPSADGGIARWTCPKCGRAFGRTNQSHQCEPTLTLDEYFAGRSRAQREALDAIITHLETLGPVLVEAVHIGVLIKRSRTFAELRPKRGHMSLSLLLSRVIDHPRFTRTIRTSGSRPGRRAAHFIDVRSSEDIDDEVRAWLTEAYHNSPVG